MIPTYVVVPVIEIPDQPITYEGAQSVTALPNGCEGPEFNLSAKWNLGLDMAEKFARTHGAEQWNVAILNDDIEAAPDLLDHLGAGLRRTFSGHGPVDVAYVNCHGAVEDSVYQSAGLAGQTMAGWCFMLRGELDFRFDEQFVWWYGDADLEMQVRRDGGVAVCVASSHARHLRPMESTRDNPELLQLAREDEARFAEKWNIDPASLWLAQNPTWGET